MKTRNFSFRGASLVPGVVLFSLLIILPFCAFSQFVKSDKDFGDASDGPYPTLLIHDGARHIAGSATYLGGPPDIESDGIPSFQAIGDDLTATDDEDGVDISWPISPGNPCLITVNASGQALFNAWFDFNGNGSWAEADEHPFNDLMLETGNNYLTFMVPATATTYDSACARFRFSHQPALSYTGEAFDGEVEDYGITVTEFDSIKWQQLPGQPFTGMHADATQEIADDWICNGGAVTDIHWWGNYELDPMGFEKRGSGINHFIVTIYSESNCLPASPLITYIVPYTPVLEQPTGLFNSEGAPVYLYEYILPQPFIQVQGTKYWVGIRALSNDLQNPAIWRWQEANRWYWPIQCGAAANNGTNWQTIFWSIPPPGKYSDMAFMITSTPILDFGDAPDPTYPTLLVSNGARHSIDNATYLGLLIDQDVDGQPLPGAMGDDLSNLDDEDGVAFLWPLATGNPCKINVIASTGDALFNGWIDFNGNGSWADAGEHVFADLNLLAGSNILTFIVPRTAEPGPTYARFRFSHQPSLDVTGEAFDGEVEDYAVEIIEYGDLKWHQPPDTLYSGVHATEGNVLADDWICNGGVVTDLHWYGNYELDDLGNERKGSWINHFILSIYSDSNCLPKNLLASFVVPYTPALEVFTGLKNPEGSRIYKYDFVLPEPFIQERDTTYWLSVNAISNIQSNPAMWRWQEANRWMFPIHCGAARLSGVWQTIMWPFTPLIKYSDFAFEITSWRTDTLYLRDIDVTTGDNNCYDANLVIIVAGGGTTFHVYNGGSATMIAGQKISYLPGTTVDAGGYLHGYITTTGQFCNSLAVPGAPPPITLPEPTSAITLADHDHIVRLFPNPTTGDLTIDLTSYGYMQIVRIQVYNLMGQQQIDKKIKGGGYHTLSLEQYEPGLYILKVLSHDGHYTFKVIKQ